LRSRPRPRSRIGRWRSGWPHFGLWLLARGPSRGHEASRSSRSPCTRAQASSRHCDPASRGVDATTAATWPPFARSTVSAPAWPIDGSARSGERTSRALRGCGRHLHRAAPGGRGDRLWSHHRDGRGRWHGCLRGRNRCSPGSSSHRRSPGGARVRGEGHPCPWPGAAPCLRPATPRGSWGRPTDDDSEPWFRRVPPESAPSRPEPFPADRRQSTEAPRLTVEGGSRVGALAGGTPDGRVRLDLGSWRAGVSLSWRRASCHG